jgi:glycosyltransferase involved in cell wall biosynthesis
MMRQYVIVSPVRDEEEYIEQTILGVVQQTIRPTEWIIVDDGSRDRTGEIIDAYAKKYYWIRTVHRTDRGKRVPGSGVIDAFYDGYDRLESENWDFIVKLDGDVGLPFNYFEECFKRFTEDPKLGMCGGRKPEPHPAFHVRGPIKLYRRECWVAIGGLIRAPGWDTVDEVQANRFGWLTRTFGDIKVIHQRPTGAVQGVWRDGVKMGRAAYICGYHPLFMIVKCAKRASSMAHGYGFASGYFKRISRFEDRGLIQYLRNQQIRRLLFLESIWK